MIRYTIYRKINVFTLLTIKLQKLQVLLYYYFVRPSNRFLWLVDIFAYIAFHLFKAVHL